jgi:GNAT superfamily N-acetyltransferase
VSAAALEVRRSGAADLRGVFALLRASLGWTGDPRHEALFAWKHHENPFGASPAWVAVDGERVVGLRVLMRWEFEYEGRVVGAVRAVDTATHPEYQGRGVFSRLTRAAVDELTAEGVGFVFNTPNRQSRPGYLKLGWREVGRLPIAARPTSLRGLMRMSRSRAAAERWSAPSSSGTPAADVLGDRAAVRRLLDGRASTSALRTRLTPEYLVWRYCSPIVDYRAMVDPRGVEAGVAIFRIRRRGAAREAVLCDVLVPDTDPRCRRELVRGVLGVVDADYVIASRAPAVRTAGLMPLPRQGPLITWRALACPRMPPRAAWGLQLGDIELF